VKADRFDSPGLWPESAGGAWTLRMVEKSITALSPERQVVSSTSN